MRSKQKHIQVSSKNATFTPQGQPGRRSILYLAAVGPAVDGVCACVCFSSLEAVCASVCTVLGAGKEKTNKL